jgi:hypothetical protein
LAGTSADNMPENAKNSPFWKQMFGADIQKNI